MSNQISISLNKNTVVKFLGALAIISLFLLPISTIGPLSFSGLDVVKIQLAKQTTSLPDCLSKDLVLFQILLLSFAGLLTFFSTESTVQVAAGFIGLGVWTWIFISYFNNPSKSMMNLGTGSFISFVVFITIYIIASTELRKEIQSRTLAGAKK